MPRNSSGTYSLPAGNPVVAGTTITVSWGNSTLSDIASALTDSLSRSGDGGMTAPLELEAGTAAAPALTFTLDPNIGIYRYGADQLGFSTGGVYRGSFGNTFFDLAVPILVADGAVATPSYTFANDLDTGIYRGGTNTMVLAVGGNQALVLTPSLVYTGAGFLFHISDGGVGAPGLAFSGDTDTGIYRTAADSAALAAGGNQILVWNSSGGAMREPWGFADGDANSPGIQFDGDGDTGFYRRSSGDVGFSSNTNLRVVFNDSGLLMASGGSLYLQDGSSANPAITFLNNQTSGFYLSSTNVIGIALGGASAGQIAQGSFTGTLTGMSGSTTATVNYRLMGGWAFLWLSGGFSGTSNSSDMTMTGIPAALTPSITRTGACLLTDSASIIHGSFSMAGTTMTFAIAADDVSTTRILVDANGFTPTGVKGLPPGWVAAFPIP